MNNNLILILKICISAFSLYFLSKSVDTRYITILISNIDLKFLFLALVIFWIAQIISALRYAYIAEELGKNLPLSVSAKAHFIGLWFNQILPTGLGGDVIKVAMLREMAGFGVALKAAILDRCSGFFIIMIAITFTLPLYSKVLLSGQDTIINGLKFLVFCFLFSMVILLWLSSKLYGQLNSAKRFSKWINIVSDIWFFRKGRPLWRQIWTSSIVHINGIITYALLGLALGYDLNFLSYFLLVPLVFLISLIPVSFAGWGIREAGAIWLFGMVNMPKEDALILSIAYGTMLILSGLPGLILFMQSKHLMSKSRNHT